ncbi:hypothetical protein DM860_009351 [Cuscuta australis]|nr:hypothetical protein DM860_009351 [Cuscuta australis]
MKPVYPDDMEVVPITIKKGEYIDVISLLSSNKSSDANSNYLLRSKSFDQVQVESLKGKYVCLCCFVVPVVFDGCQACLAQSFSQLSHELSSRNDFEMVLVIKMKQPWKDEKGVFDHFMSAFNCLVVPYEHAFQRDKICMSLKRLSFGLGGFIVDPNQNVVQEHIWCLHHCGGGAFPFTDDKLLLYFNRNWEGKSIEELLLGDSSSLLLRKVNGQAEKICISALKTKFVVLYLCANGWGADIPLLEKVCQHCETLGHELEIVFTCIPYQGYNPEVFQEVIESVLKKRGLSWWILPFNNTTCHRLNELFPVELGDMFVIISHGECVEPYGKEVILNLGIDTYPFTRDSFIRNTFKRLNELSLESLLERSTGNIHRGNDPDAQLSVTSLRGKNVLLYVGRVEKRLMHLADVKKWYNEIKERIPDFELLFVPLDTSISKEGAERMLSMPWFVCSSDPALSEFVAATLIISEYFQAEDLFAFGPNGRICSIDVLHILCWKGISSFPYVGDLVEEICSKLEESFDNDYLSEMAWGIPSLLRIGKYGDLKI